MLDNWVGSTFTEISLNLLDGQRGKVGSGIHGAQVNESKLFWWQFESSSLATSRSKCCFLGAKLDYWPAKTFLDNTTTLK